MSELDPHTPHPEHLSFSFEHTREDIANLDVSRRDFLADCEKTALPDLKKRLVGTKKPVRILNLACGRADETGILMKIRSPSAEACELVGIDIREREIDEANQRWNVATGGAAQFLVHDGTKLDEIKGLKEGFNYAFMRHQNYWNGDLTWHKIYDQALHLLKPEGLLIITSYFDREHMLAMRAIQSLGAKLLLTWQNPRTRMIEEKYAKSAARHIAIFKLP